jgi:hypothetical protein
LILVDREAGAPADRPDPDFSEIDVPGLEVRVVGTAAGEGGHAPRIPPRAA